MEIWDLYTEDGRLTGQKHRRGEELPDNLYHLVVHIWIKNAQGQYLIAQRAASRPQNPLKWECQGGSVLYGETSLEGAIREVKEEVGLELKPQNGRRLFRHTRGIINGCKFNDIMDVWLFEYDGPVNLKAATTDEVAQVQWLTAEQIRHLAEKENLVPTLMYFFDKVNADS